MKKVLFTLLSAVLVTACNAQQPTPAKPAPATNAAATAATANSGAVADVEKALAERFKGAPIKGVRASVMPGLFEAQIGEDMIYFDAKVNHFIVGNLVEATTMTNLTEQRVAELNAIDVKQLPLENAIKFVRGKGERVMYVFTDVDCPFCTRLEQTIQSMDNVTVYNFMYPIDSLHPQAHKKQAGIWCAKDRLKAWQDGVLEKKFDQTAKTDCANPVEATKQLGAKLGVRATPTFFLADGRLIAGAIPKDRLEAALDAAQTRVAAKK